MPRSADSPVRELWLLITAVLLLTAGPTMAAELGPADDWCAAVQALGPGEEAVLRPGDYPGPCTINRGGTPGSPLVIRAKDPENPPRIVYLGRESNVLNIRADHVTVRGLQFGPTVADVDAIRIYQGNGITIEDCRFTEISAIAIVANHVSVRGLTVRGNRIENSRATAMYFGCHDGQHCRVSELLIERNYIDRVTGSAGGVGYGMQVKLNSTAVIRDNVVLRTKGPGIMVYGARDPGIVSLVERNFVSESQTSSGIVLGGGPAIVRNNVAVASAEAGIALEDYGRRGLLRRIVVAHNTIFGNDGGGIAVPEGGRLEVTLANNAVHARMGAKALPLGRLGVLSLGNVDCSWLPCFAGPEARDFSPLSLFPGLSLREPWMPADDYFRRPRGNPPTVGASEGRAGPLPLGMKPTP